LLQVTGTDTQPRLGSPRKAIPQKGGFDVVADFGQLLRRRTRIAIRNSVDEQHAVLGLANVHENAERFSSDDDPPDHFTLTQQRSLLVQEPGV
jgi:hypothetical protein